MIQFFIPMKQIPSVTAQQGNRTTRRGRHYKEDRLTDAEQLYTALFAPHRPAQPLSGPLRLTFQFCFPVTGKHKHGERKTTKPDNANAIKVPEDCLTRLKFWKDDAQVSSHVLDKVYWEPSGVFVRIEELPEYVL